MSTLRSVFVASTAGMLLVVSAACSSVAPYAARVDGATISEDELVGELRSIASNEAYLQLIEERQSVRGAGEGTFDAVFTASMLTRQIYFALISTELEERDLSVGEDDLDAARASVIQQLGDEEVFAEFSSGYRDDLVRRQAELDVLTLALSEQGSPEEVARAFYESNPEEFARACVQHILVETQEEAEQLRQRLAEGEDFAALARAESVDEGSKEQGGDLGCDITPETNFVDEFKLAVFTQPVGEAGQPVQTQFGWHLVKVSEREVPPFEEVADQARSKATAIGQAQVLGLLQQAAQAARIEVNPKYGSFVKAGPSPRVVPPASSPPTTVAGGLEPAPAPETSNP